MHAGWIEMIVGNPAAAEQVLTEGCQALREMGERGYLTNVLATLAHPVYAQGRLGEADRLAHEAEAITYAEDDIDGRVRACTRRTHIAQICDHHGRHRHTQEAAHMGVA